MTQESATAAPHAVPAAAVADALAVDPDVGLSTAEAGRRARTADREPTARERRAPAAVGMAVRQLVDPLVLLLTAAAGISAAIGHGLEAVAIGAIVAANAALGFFEELRAEHALAALRAATPSHGVVLRDGAETEVTAADLVPGDVLVLAEGDRVLADARVVGEGGLEVDESVLTGESVPVAKSGAPVDAASPLAERPSMVFAGTAVTRGSGRAIVTAVRGGTELGRTTALAEQVKPPPTPLQRRSAALARAMVAIGLVVTAVVAAGMALRDEPLREAFLVAVSVAIAAVPEGLTATVSVALALGVRAMARRGAIVRTLTAIETIGATTVICSDKTGTLTENRLRLTGTVPVAGGDERSVLEAALLAADPWLPGRDGSAPVSGDPLVRALHEGAAERGVAPTALPAGRSVVATVPFDSVARLSAALYDEGGERRAFVLGAPETILVRSTLGEAARAALADEAAALGRRGMRVLAAAGRRHVPGDDLAEALATLQLEPIGLVAFADPLRPAAREAVERARGAGIHVRMLTGDQASTALAIGAELGLDPASVHARMTPADKLTLVGALQDAGGVVAVTGDGVNDAPALRRADVGIAMGRSGTEVAREAADVVLTDDDFATIVAAVEAGRRISDNVRAAVAFLLSANLGEVLLVLVAVLAGLGAPLTVVQLLTVNLLTDGFPALALARDRSAQDSMRRPPVPATTLFGGALGGVLAVGSVLVGLAGLGAFLAGRSDGAATGQTMAFATIALAELLFAFSCRVPSGPLWRAPRNGALIGAAMLSLGVVAAVVLAEPLHEPFGTIRLSASQALLVAVLALVPTAGTEAAKLLSARRAAARAPALARRPAEREQTRARRR